MSFTRRGVLTLGVAGLAAAVGTGPAGATVPLARRRGSTAPPVATDLPPLDADLLAASIDRPLERDATGVLVQISGGAGCWDGTSGTARLGSPRPVPQDGRFRIGSITRAPSPRSASGSSSNAAHRWTGRIQRSTGQ